MAETRFGTTDALAVKQWARRLEYQVIYRSEISALVGEDANSIIHLKTETKKDAGDKVTFALLKKLTGAGFTENETAEGSGESLSIYSDSVTINELGNVVNIPYKGRSIDAQRIPFELRTNAMNALKDWWDERLSVSFFNQVCGYTPQTDTKYTGLNAVVAPSSGRHLWVGASAANTADEGIDSTDTFDLRWVDYAVETAKSATTPVKPLNIKGEGGGRDIAGGKYVMYLHPYQVTDLRTRTSTGQWQDIQKAAMMAGESSKNPIFTGALGMYNNVILREANHVTQGVNSSTGAAITTVRRAVLLGAQACAMAFSKGGSASAMNWNEENIDHKRRLEVSCMSMFGLTKTQFDSTDYGTIVVSSYAAAHT